MHVSALQTSSGMFCVLALDTTPTVANELGLDLDLEPNQQFFAALNEELLKHLSPMSSGVVLDPIFTLPLLSHKANQPGLALRLEQLTPGTDPLVIPTIIPNWGVEHISQNYGVTKVEMYYHPEEMEALAKKQLIAEINDFCDLQHSHLLLKLMIYTQPDDGEQGLSMAEVQLEAVTELRSNCQLLVLQPPPDSLTAATLTAELDVPWLVSLEGLEYATAKDIMRQALESGAKGAYLGDVVWRDIRNLRQADASLDWPAIQTFIATEARDRMIELRRIIDEFANI
ncbi:MAG TPA: hypothetical protein VD999_03080 [Vitreimonas sp.]|nr:hypothetical protein [Vitreimonas sp.]